MLVSLVSEGEFPLLRYFYVRRHVHLTCVKKIEAMYGRSCFNIKVKTHSTFTFTRDLSYIAPMLFTPVNFTRVHVRR